MVKILNKENTILNKFLAEMRDKSIQKDSMRFRRNMERVAEVMAYEISKKLNYKTKMVETPLGIAAVESISDKGFGYGSERHRRAYRNLRGGTEVARGQAAEEDYRREGQDY